MNMHNHTALNVLSGMLWALLFLLPFGSCDVTGFEANFTARIKSA
jgi:hypothetical protein